MTLVMLVCPNISLGFGTDISKMCSQMFAQEVYLVVISTWWPIASHLADSYNVFENKEIHYYFDFFLA
jgi:hypothetical protein